jgi:2-polyprenyl-3-methyl-5-hydroxy-6-metoxy-1,4-benzoquinol methylase
MKRNRWIMLISLFLVPLLFGVFITDLAGAFSFSDVPFAIALVLYILFIILQRSTSKTTFFITILFLLLMGLMYVPTGSGSITERIGVWFCVFFLLAMVQYRIETLKEQRVIPAKNNRSVDWDYYFGTCMYPSKNGWHRANLTLYRKWYVSWLSYINLFVPIFTPGLTAFEFGSGIGAVASLLHDHGVDITGSDISQKAVYIANKLVPQVKFIMRDVEKGIPNGRTYDRVFAFEVLEHVHNIEKAMVTIKKQLKNGGYFIGTTPYPYKKNLLDPTHVSIHKPIFWKELFEKHGFREVIVRPMSCLPYIWKFHPLLHPIIPFYIPFPYFVSTTLIVARV